MFRNKLDLKARLTFPVFTVILSILLAPAILAQETLSGEQVFVRTCSGCHTFGGGDLVGPDLKGVVEKRGEGWVHSFITDPAAMRASGDPIAVGSAKSHSMEMPTLGLPDTEVNQVIDYLESASVDEQGEGETSLHEVLEKGDPVNGGALFNGSARFLNGGPGCASCHIAGGPNGIPGGTLGPDLTGLYKKSGGPAINAMLGKISFPTMKPLFEDKPLTDTERADLIAYLASVTPTGPKPKGSIAPFAGIVFSILLFALFNGLWRKRHKGVRAELIAKAKLKRGAG